MANATLDVFDYSTFTNNGAGVTWIPFDLGGTDYHRHHDGRPAHRAAAAHLRQRSGDLEHPGQQRDLRDPGRVLLGVQLGSTAQLATWTATAISRSPSSTTGGPAQHAPPPRSPAPVLRQLPRTTADRSPTPTSSLTATSSGAGPAATPPAWPPTSKASGTRLPVLLALLRRRRYRLLPVHRPG